MNTPSQSQTCDVTADGERRLPSIFQLINRLPEPVFVVSAEGRVLAANAPVSGLLKKTPSALEGALGGDAFDCTHARQPGGCGAQVHCRSCVIRRTVGETFETGVAQRRIPACVDTVTADGNRSIEYLISTEKVGGVVLLKIEQSAG